MHRLTDDERPHYDRWLASLAGGDERLLHLLRHSLGRIAAGNLRRILARRGPDATMKLSDLPTSKPWADAVPVIVDWLRDSIRKDADWLRDTDADGVPRRLAECEDYDDLLDAATEDYGARPRR